MAGDSLWIKNGKIIVENGTAIICKRCPCECEPRVIKSFKVNRKEGPKCYDLTPYQGKGVGTPGYRWRLIEIGESGCGSTRYGSGNINDDGVLVGLQPEFCTPYSYDGYMSLQEGCYDENGNLIWPDTCERD